MFLQRFCLGILAFAAISAIAIPTQAQAERFNVEAFIQQWDADRDGTLSLEEVRKAATARFEALDRRHKGILTRTQLAGVLTFQQFREANADKQGALDLNEFLSVVEKLFRCDTADGFPVEVDGWDMAGIVDDTSGMAPLEASNARSGYRVRLRDGKWHDVPNFALIDPKTNKLGYAVVWLLPSWSLQIYCFLPGSGG